MRRLHNDSLSWELMIQSRRIALVWTLLLTSALLLPHLVACGSSGASSPAPPVRPRLVVVLVVDQMRADYLERFRTQFTGGLKTFLEQGAVFANANYEQWPTVTAVGHATISTGATPASHGIVGNAWYDRVEKKEVASVDDGTATIVPTGKGTGVSPHRLIGTTIGDEVRLATNDRSRVISVALKDRSAIMLGGHRPSGAFWFDTSAGAFVSSSYYGATLPSWVTSFNGRKPADAYFSSSWNRLLPESEYAASDPDDSEGESAPMGTRVFPHRPAEGLTAPGSKFYERLLGTPFANDMLLAFAREAVTSEQLGRDEFPDVLMVGLSSNDLIGHYYGPYSREVQDVTLRTDRSLGEFFEFLDGQVGKGNYLAVLSADHGVAPTPTHAKSIGGRYTRLEDVEQPIEQALTARFGGSAKWVSSVSEGTSGGVYLDSAVIAAQKADPVEVQHEALRAIAGLSGVRFAMAGVDIAAGRFNTLDLQQRRVAAGYCPGRSPDLFVIFDPFQVMMGGPTGTSHGTPYSYDSHVPLLFYGTGVTPSTYLDRVAVTDIAATVCALLGVTPPSGCSGRPILGVAKLASAPSH
jgi:predicted AlkP superfamily pyrophosphatase or phosphodiesterase